MLRQLRGRGPRAAVTRWRLVSYKESNKNTKKRLRFCEPVL